VPHLAGCDQPRPPSICMAAVKEKR
jgi:hypothetical protein